MLLLVFFVYNLYLLTGDKWMVSCLGVLYLTKGLFYRVVPADQRVDEAYAGVFRLVTFILKKIINSKTIVLHFYL